MKKNNKKGRLPNLIIIGAMKGGTTSLHYYLSLHPQISMSNPKELRFFIDNYKGNWHKGIDWYKSHFTEETEIQGESSPGYSIYPFNRDIPERIYSVIPDTKLIYILRDPVERILSHYHMDYSGRIENLSVEEALEDMESSLYVFRSRYFIQLERYLQYFDKSKILILTTENLHNKRLETMQKIFSFLNVDDSFFTEKFFLKWHQSKFNRRKTEFGEYLEKRLPLKKILYKFPFESRGIIEKLFYLPFSRNVKRPVLEQGLRQKLADFLKDDIEQLKEFTGYEFKEWSL